MDFVLMDWHWVVLGIVLALSEMFIASFFILWFGIAAILVGFLLFLFPDFPVAGQIFLWSFTSVGLAFFWFKYLKPLSVDKTKAGLSRESLVGAAGLVLSLPQEDQRGILRFSAPILGADEWLFISQDVLFIGDRVIVVEVSGNTLIVRKV